MRLTPDEQAALHDYWDSMSPEAQVIATAEHELGLAQITGTVAIPRQLLARLLDLMWGIDLDDSEDALVDELDALLEA